MISAQCPRCLRKYRIPPEHVGAIVNCRAAGCSQSFQVPPADPEILLPVNSKASSPAVPPLPPVTQEPDFGSSDVVVSRGVIPEPEKLLKPASKTRHGSVLMLCGVGFFMAAMYFAMFISLQYTEPSVRDALIFFGLMGCSTVASLWGFVSWAMDDRTDAIPLFPVLNGFRLAALSVLFFAFAIGCHGFPLNQWHDYFDEQRNQSAVEWMKFAMNHREPLEVVFVLTSPVLLVWGIVRWLGMRGRIDDDLSQVR